jgi:glyoxylase-like metal-dependent hydrolase (beta-lactamase superfamily II)
MKKALKILGAVVGVLVLLIAGLFLIFFAGLQKAGTGPSLGAGFEPDQDGMSTVYLLFGARNPFHVGHPLDDGEKVSVGALDVTAFAVPGHTPGSGAYLVQGVLFLGDAAEIDSKQRIVGPNWLFSNDTKQSAASLRHLAEELKPRAGEVKLLATAHTGNLAGLQPVLDFE